jgi:hypothetical protein
MAAWMYRARDIEFHAHFREEVEGQITPAFATPPTHNRITD